MADERVTKSDVLDALYFYKVNADSSGTGGGLQPIIQVTCESSDITVTKSGVNYPATSHNGNIHTFIVPDFGTYDIIATYELGFTRTRSINVDTVKVYTVTLNALRYGYRIKKNESDPYVRVEYLYDAVGMTPAHMDFTNGVFDYGSWKDVWFVADNKPLMLKSNGTVDYYLNPNDYTLKKDGTASDVANENYDGNAMAQFPLCWIYRYEDNDYLYEIVSNVQYDENYKAYAHTDKDGNIKDYFYCGMYAAGGSTSKLRSLSGLSTSMSYNEALSAASANGANWYILSWAQHELLRTYSALIFKTCDILSAFGAGNSDDVSDNKGQFYHGNFIKAFHIRDGLIMTSGQVSFAGAYKLGNTIRVKMTPENGGYFSDSYFSNYIDPGIKPPQRRNTSYISAMTCNQYGMFPTAFNASSSTYFCAPSMILEYGLVFSQDNSPFCFIVSRIGVDQKISIIKQFLAYV